MKIHRFILDNIQFNDLKGNDYSIEDQRIIHQVKNVLRLKIGEKISIIDGVGNELIGEIIALSKKNIVVSIESIENVQNELKHKVVLYCSIIKRENFELLIQKATELGVNAIAPIITERTVVKNVSISRLKKIVTEASEQCGRSIVPKIFPVKKFNAVLKDIKKEKNVFNIIFFPAAIGDDVYNYSNQSVVNLFIGPEGGWTDKELKLAQDNQFRGVCLSRFILRAETAGILAVYWAVKN